jgi:hypothetical protein
MERAPPRNSFDLLSDIAYLQAARDVFDRSERQVVAEISGRCCYEDQCDCGMIKTLSKGIFA